MTKKEMRLLILLGISIILANLVLRLILRPLPENIAYLIKTLGLMCVYYFIVQRREIDEKGRVAEKIVRVGYVSGRKAV